MTTDCNYFEPFVAGHVDGQLDQENGARLAQHLQACPACRSLVGAERDVRHALRTHADELREPAPAPLRAALTRRATVVPFVPRPRRTRPWQWIPLPAVAALLIALTGIIAVGALAPRGTALAAQLTVDHLKCILLADRHQHPDAHAVAADWQARRGWAVEVPPSSEAERLELIALRRCLFTDGELAHLVYMQAGRPVSVFILPHARASSPELAIMGHEMVSWTRDGRTYAVVADLPAADLERVVAYVQPRVR
jgi:anti-sigma factor (TIGR02949 family)